MNQLSFITRKKHKWTKGDDIRRVFIHLFKTFKTGLCAKLLKKLKQSETLDNFNLRC